MKNSAKRLITLIMVAAMIFTLAVPAYAVEGSDGYFETPTVYTAGEYDFGKISHPDSGVKEPDGLVDYMGSSKVAVTGTVEGADGQGDRGQSYSWAAMAYGDYVYVGTCYAAMGQTLTAMDTVMGHDFDEEVMRAELNAIFNGSFFYGQEDGGNSKGVLVKVNVHTGEMTLLMSDTLGNGAPLFRNAIMFRDKIYFCGSVNDGQGGLPSIYEVDPATDKVTKVYVGLSNAQEYYAAYKKGICTGIRGMAVYEDKLVVSNVGLEGAYLLISDNPSAGQSSFTKIAVQEDLFDYPAIRYVDSVYGGGIWEIVEYGGSLYVAMCSGTPETRVGDTMRSFAIVRGDCSGDWNDPDAWTWTPVIGDKADGAKYTFGIDPERTRAAACNMCIYDGYLYIGEYNDEEIPLEELMFEQDFGFLARNLEQSVNLYRMDENENIELIVGEPTDMFPNGGILCSESGFGDYENQYFWQSKVFDGKLFLGTFDTSSLLHPLGQFTNGDLLKMSREEWASQVNYLKVMFKLMFSSKDDESTASRGLFSALSKDKATTLVDEAVEDAQAEDSSVEISDEQHASLIKQLIDGSLIIKNLKYTTSTINKIFKLNSLLGDMTDLVETNDIATFAEKYEEANNIFSSLTDKLPQSLKDAYAMLVRVTELENMKDLLTCLKYLSRAERGFGLYTIESNNGVLTLETLTRDGFGDPYNHGLRAFATNDEQGWMVIGTANPFMGTQLWRTVIGSTDTDTGSDDVDDDSSVGFFTDIKNLISDFKEAIGWAFNKGITTGTSDTTFSPDDTCTRAQVVTFLWRAMGSEEVDGDVGFKDVSASDYYYDAVKWAVSRGITTGTGDDTFSPDAECTRAQVVTFLNRADGGTTGASASFSDVPVSEYYSNAVAWAVENGITNGTGGSLFAPNDSCTRAQIVTFIHRYMA